MQCDGNMSKNERKTGKTKENWKTDTIALITDLQVSLEIDERVGFVRAVRHGTVVKEDFGVKR